MTATDSTTDPSLRATLQRHIDELTAGIQRQRRELDAALYDDPPRARRIAKSIQNLQQRLDALSLALSEEVGQ